MSAAAFLRDASWRNRPNTSSAKRYHLQSTREPGMTACGAGAILDGLSEKPAHEVPETWRCQRNGCRQLWLLPDLPARPTRTPEQTIRRRLIAAGRWRRP